MQEFTTDQITSSISGDDSVGFIARCDVAVFVFDSSSLDSFKHAQTLLDKMVSISPAHDPLVDSHLDCVSSSPQG